MTLSTTSPGDEREAAQTKAIAYPDADLSCGLSTDGILICGDERSINRVRNALHAEKGTIPALRAELLEARAALSSSTVQQVGAETEAFVRDLLWNDHPECCGCPVVGAEYMGAQEMTCCGNPEPALLNDKQIVASLRARFPVPSEGDQQ